MFNAPCKVCYFQQIKKLLKLEQFTSGESFSCNARFLAKNGCTYAH